MRMRVPATHGVLQVEKGIRMQVEATASSPLNVRAVHVSDDVSAESSSGRVAVTYAVEFPGTGDIA